MHHISTLSPASCHLTLIDVAQAFDTRLQLIATSPYLLRIPSPAAVRSRAPNPSVNPSRASPRYRIAIVSSTPGAHLKEKVSGTCEIVEHDSIVHSGLSITVQVQSAGR